jgi:hypothetical protein
VIEDDSVIEDDGIERCIRRFSPAASSSSAKHETISATMRASAVTARSNAGHGRSVEVMHKTGHHGGVEQLHERPGLICTAECMRKAAARDGRWRDEDMDEQLLRILLGKNTANYHALRADLQGCR